MIDLPEEIKLRHFEESLKRGAVFRFLVTPPLLRDPSRQEHHKFAVVLSTSCEGGEVVIALTTSNLARLSNPRFAGDYLRIAAGYYAFLPLDTLLNLRELEVVSLRMLSRLQTPFDFQMFGELSEAHMAEVTRIIERSRLIPLRLKLRCLPPRPTAKS